MKKKEKTVNDLIESLKLENSILSTKIINIVDAIRIENATVVTNIINDVELIKINAVPNVI